MLHRVHRRVTAAELGSPLGLCYLIDTRRNSGTSRQIDPAEQDSLARFCWPKRQLAVRAEVQAYACHDSRRCDCPPAHVVGFSATNRSRARIIFGSFNSAADARSDSRCCRAG